MSGGDLVRTLLGVILALLFVLALAAAVIWLLRQLQDRQSGARRGAPDGHALQFLRALPVGPRERAVLVRVDGERLLLGVAAGSVTLLARLPAAAPDDAAPAVDQ